MKIPIYHIDAFAGEVFRGNPAAVCPLESWLGDDLLQDIAAENNLSETAFLVPREKHYELRWFSPKTEVDLCGHATLAAAFVIFHALDIHRSAVCFETRSGELAVERQGPRLVLDLPARPAESCSAPSDLVRGLGAKPREVFRAADYLAVFEDEEQVRYLEPDLAALHALDARGVIVTAPGADCDFVSRFFAPRLGIPEDPVTGSAHCTLVPYWAEELGKVELQARQLSARGGELDCEYLGNRVKLAGEAVMYLEGTISV